MQIIKTHQEYISKLFLKKLIVIVILFAGLTFILNILEEVKFFNELELNIYYPLFFTLLNLPSILFEIFPFIVLISTQNFFMHLYNNDEIIIFKNYGIKNIDIIKNLSLITFIFGIFLVFGFHTFSSSLKFNYLGFKNKFTNDNKYLAVINDSGLWIKDEIDQTISIINAEKFENNLLKTVSISQLDKNFKLEKTILADEVNITKKNWKVKNAKVYEVDGKSYKKEFINYKSNFDLEKINSLFSNLTSLNIFQLKSQYNDYRSLGYSTLDIESQLNKLYALPFYLVIMILISSILMLNVRHNKSKVLNIVLGIFLSVSIYYINYFFNILGLNERIPIVLSVWFPLIMLSMIALIGLLKINEK